MADETAADARPDKTTRTWAQKSPPISKELTDAVRKLVSRGMPPRSAAQAVGVMPDTFHRWMVRGQRADAMLRCPADERPYKLLYRTVSLAQATAVNTIAEGALACCQREMIGMLVDPRTGKPRQMKRKRAVGAALAHVRWHLERLDRQAFHLPTLVQHTGEVGVVDKASPQAIAAAMNREFGTQVAPPEYDAEEGNPG